jgi:hypothetical protein
MNPIIFLWAHPLSMSTVIERVMRERSDLDCLHEPFLRYYYLERVNLERVNPECVNIPLPHCQPTPHLKGYLEHHLPFYHKLRKHSLTSLAHGH